MGEGRIGLECASTVDCGRILSLSFELRRVLFLLTSLKHYMEAQTNKKITLIPYNLAKRTLELEAKHDQVHTLFHLQIDAGPAEGLRWRRRGHTTWSATQGNPTSRATTAVERQPYYLWAWRDGGSSHQRAIGEELQENKPDAEGATILHMLPPP
jgi:hypothetical protein